MEDIRRDPLHDSTETENQNKNRESKEVQRDISHELLVWLQYFNENWVDESISEGRRRDLMQKSADTSRSSHEPPVSREHTWNRVRVSTVHLRTFRRIRIVKYA